MDFGSNAHGKWNSPTLLHGHCSISGLHDLVSILALFVLSLAIYDFLVTDLCMELR